MAGKVRSSQNGSNGKEGKRVSSISKSNKIKESQSSKKTADEDSAISTSFNKALASTEKSIRDGAVDSLTSYLIQSSSEPLSSLEMAKLWKGIFYCFWMSDKPRVQHALAQQLADILLTIQESSDNSSSATNDPSWQFFEGFMDTMVREWWGLDKHRVDKFMMLVRRFLNGAFRLLDKQEWQKESIDRFTSMLNKEDGGILFANHIKKPVGLFYHFCDIYLEELEKALNHRSEESEDEDVEGKKNVSVTAILRPFVDMAANCQTKLHYDRIMDAVIGPYLDASAYWERVEHKGKNSNRQRHENDDDHYPIIFNKADKSFSKLREEIFASIFTAASRPDSCVPRRRALFKMFREEQERLEEEEM